MDTIPLLISIASILSLALTALMIWYAYSPLPVAVDVCLIALAGGVLSLAGSIAALVMSRQLWLLLILLMSLGGIIWSVFLRWFIYRKTPVVVNTDGRKLSGTLYFPVGQGFFPTVVFLPGPGQSTRLDWREQAKLLCRHKVAALVYDKRGCGESTGTSCFHSFAALADDTASMISAASSLMMVDPQKIALWAYDEGGWVAPLVVERVSSIAGVVLVSATHRTPADHILNCVHHALKSVGASALVIEGALRFQRRIFAYLRSGGGSTETFKAELEHAAEYPWYDIIQRFSFLADEDAQDWLQSVMDYNPEPRWQWVLCPVLAIAGGQDHILKFYKTQYILRKALKKRGNTQFSACVLNKMRHHPHQWWLPWKVLPPRYAPGYKKCLLRWIRQTLLD